MIVTNGTGASTRGGSRPPYRASHLAVAAWSVTAALAGIMCGGTTGHEGLDQGSDPDAAIESEGGPGADMDSGAFDVTIDYATRALPDVVAPPDTGTGGEYPWPSCPPFIP